MRRVLLAVAALLASACGQKPPATLAEQRAVVEARPDADPARRGWWRYVAGDVEGAREDFARAPDAPLAALGRARLAADALDAPAVLAAAAVAAHGDGVVGRLGHQWAEAAAEDVPDGEATLRRALGTAAADRAPLEGATHTLRISFLPFLDLRRLIAHPPVAKGDSVRALGRRWALESRAPRADPDGLILTRWPLEPGEAHLELHVDGPARAWRDGRLVMATADDRHGPRTQRFTAAGEGPLIVVWAARSGPKAWRWRRPAAAASVGLGPAVPDRRPTPDAVERYLALEAALLDGDAEATADLLNGAPPSAPFAALAAEAALAAPDASTRQARDAARAHWTAAAPVMPARAALALGRLALRTGDLDEADAQLTEAVRRAPDAFAAHRARLRALAARGTSAAAEAALRAAERTAPDPCRLLDLRVSLAPDARRAPDPLVDAMVDCGRFLDAADLLLGARRPEAALARLDAADDEAARPRGRRLRARALVALGRLDAARDLYAELDGLEDALAAADLGHALGDDGATWRDALRAVVRAHPTASPSLDLVAAWPEWSPLSAVALDTEAAIAAFEAVPPLPGPAVRVLDHAALLSFADGARLRWVHEVLAIRSREAAETYGEIGLPAEVRLLALYTRKADGRRVFAEEVPEKDTISLKDLEDGDYVVAVYLEAGDNGYLYDAGYLTPRIYFRGVDLPIFHQRFEVFAPDGTPPEHQRLAAGPAPEPVSLGERAGLRFEARQVPLLPPEPDAPPPGLWLPSVRVGHRVRLDEDLDYYRDRVLALRRRSPAFEAWVRAHVGEGPRAARAARLARAVREAVDGEAGLVGGSVGVAVQSGSGNRALVLSAALEVAGVPHRLLLTRPALHVPSGPFRQVADFPYPLIEVEGGLWIDPGPDRAAPGFLPFPMLGGGALQLWPHDGPTTPRTLPTTRAVGDARAVRLDLRWHADGRLTGASTDTLVGQEAIVVGATLAQLDAARRPRLVERLLLPAVGAAQVDAFEDPVDADPDGPLTMRARFRVQGGDQLALGLSPVSPGRSHARLPERTLPLALDLPTHQTVHLVLESDRDFTGAPTDVTLAWGPHRFTRRVEIDADRVEIRSELVVAGGVIAPADYPAFAKWARQVDAAERFTLVVR